VLSRRSAVTRENCTGYLTEYSSGKGPNDLEHRCDTGTVNVNPPRVITPLALRRRNSDDQNVKKRSE
jgi:hypothetical protein